MGKGDLTRTRILDEALRLASRDGVEGLSIGTLAAALRMSKSGLFAHFGSKESLQVAVLEYASERFRTRMGPVHAATPGAESLQALLEVLMEWVDDPTMPGGCPIMAACFELDDREGAPREALLVRQRRLASLVRDAFAAMAGTGDLDQAVFEFQSLTMGYHHAARVLRDPAARQRARQALTHLLARHLQG